MILVSCAFILLAMIKEKILVIGASGQIGVELTLALRKIYGNTNVLSDLREQNPLLEGTGPYVSLDVMNKEMLHVQVIRQNITQIYLLAAILSATGEKNPGFSLEPEYAGIAECTGYCQGRKATQSLLAFFHCCIWSNITKTGLPAANHNRTCNCIWNQQICWRILV